MKPALLTAFALFLLAACGGPLGILPSTIYQLPYKAPPNAPEEYKTGWEHGCKSGFSAYGNTFYKTFYKFTQDPKMVRNPLYFKAWSDSFNYCRAYVNRYLVGHNFRQMQEGDYSPIFDPKTITIRPAFDLRDVTPEKEKGMQLGLFEGLETPGWNNLGWGAQVECQSDWLGRDGAYNWLGQHEEEGDCTWMGYGNRDRTAAN